MIDDNTTFPGLMSLPPTIGIALLLLSSPPRLLSRFLTWMPLKQIGLASYSIYLIHWPLIAFSQRTTNVPDGSIARLVIFVSAITLGYASYRLIEGPFRNPAKTIYRPESFYANNVAKSRGAYDRGRYDTDLTTDTPTVSLARYK